MKKPIIYLLFGFLIFSCINTNTSKKNSNIEYNSNLQIKDRYDLFAKIYGFDQWMSFPPNSKLRDTINAVIRHSYKLNSDCQVFEYSKFYKTPILYFGVCECELNNHSLEISLSSIDALSLEIRIRINGHNFEADYQPYETDTVKVLLKQLTLSSDNYNAGNELIGELTLNTKNDSIQGKFKCIINNQNNHDTSNIKLQEISESEIYTFINEAYLPYCIDTSAVKKIFQFPKNGHLLGAFKLDILDYLKNKEKLSHQELKFILDQLISIDGREYSFDYDTIWSWSEQKLHNVEIINKSNYERIKSYWPDSLEEFSNLYKNGLVFISRPLISNDRNFLIINEFFDDNSFCVTDKERTYVFEKISNKWNLVHLLYF
jgi:hypothetical protein